MKNWFKRASNLFFCITFLICLTASAFGQNMYRKVNDFDGDGKADFAVTRNIGGVKYWYVWQSTAGFRVFQWGLDYDREASGDYDNDGKTDFAIDRLTAPSHGQAIYAHRSATNDYFVTNFYAVQIIPFIEPAQQDYDGDGKTDTAYFLKYDNVACCRAINVYESTRNNELFRISITDVNASLLRLGDTTGDGKSEIIALNTTSNILTIENYATRTTSTVQFGTTGDQFVPADFDGDGIGDIAVFRESNGTWWWKRSSDGIVNAAQFGQVGDKPVPADYDGDGKTDLAIWRPGETQSVYWVYGSTGNIMGVPFGIATDKVVTY